MSETETKPRMGWGTRWCRDRVLSHFRTLKHGQLELREAQGIQQLGSSRSEELNLLEPKIEVRDPAFFRRVIWGGDVGAAESWIDGEWTSSNLTEVVRYFIRNLPTMDGLEKGPAAIRRWISGWIHRRRSNTLDGSRRNIGAHYDLGNDFYATFLDPTMAYSAGIFGRDATTMEEASIAKFDRICQKLDLQPSDHVVEIGTGWGGWAVHAASRYGCRVTTTTISAEQHAYASEWVKRAGLQDRVQVLDQDYRQLKGQFDKLVSIEMIEAVGHRYLPEFFRVCRKLLKDSGLAVLQAILIRDDRHQVHLQSSNFIRQYIFPGGDLPSMNSILHATSRETDLRLVHYEELSSHYAETLRRWRDAFVSQAERINQLGFDQRFCRLWNYYLSYCEAAFTERQVNSVQLALGCAGYRSESLASLPALLDSVPKFSGVHSAQASISAAAPLRAQELVG